MSRIAMWNKAAVPNRVRVALLWLAIALMLASAVHADEHSQGSASDSLHHSAAVAHEHMEHFGNRMRATTHRVIESTSRSLHRAYDATARAMEHAADKVRIAFHNI